MFFVGTGTAANALSLTLANKPGGVGFCHREAHAIEDECGAPEYFTGGARLCPVDGPLGRIDPANLERAIARYPAEFVHSGRPIAVSITQSTEIGTVYGLDEIDAIAAICRKAGLPLHMDGARFANALVSLDATPAEMTWKRGVDMLSFGGTKNGCWCAEAIVLFDPRQGGGNGLHPQARRAALSPSRASSPRSSTPISKTGCGWKPRATPIRWPPGWPATSARRRRCGSPGSPQANEVFAIMSNSEKERLPKQGRGVLRLAHAAILSRRARRRRSHLPLRHQLRDDRRRRRRVRRSDRLSDAYAQTKAAPEGAALDRDAVDG